MASPLSARAGTILDIVVETFITRGAPVGSAAVADRLSEPISSATVRNVMSQLEREGYLSQPHTSAGRMPTARGYSTYVKKLMREGRLQPVDETSIRRQLYGASPGVHSLLQRVCSTLSEMTSLVGVVLAPPPADTDIRHVELVRLGPRRVLAVFVIAGGTVHSRVLALNEDLEDRDLEAAAVYLTQRFVGRTLREARERIRASLARAESGPRPQVLAFRLARGSLGRGIEVAEVLIEGAFHLLDRPEIAGTPDIAGIFEAFEEREELGKLLTECGQEPAPRVLIGRERLPRAFGECALVAASYRSGGRSVGALGVLGPTRMQYDRAIPMVAAMARATSEALTELAG